MRRRDLSISGDFRREDSLSYVLPGHPAALPKHPRFALMLWILMACVVGLGPLGASRVYACTVPIASPFAGEQDHVQIFSHLLAQPMAWAPPNVWGTQDIVGTTWKATRLDESDPALSIGRLDSDRIWGNVVFQLTAVGTFGRNTQYMGYQPVGSSSWVEILDVGGGYGYTASGNSAVVDLRNTSFTWSRRGDGNPYSSLESQNLDGMDHMLTYRLDYITPPATPPTRISYFLFWEDLHRRGTSPIPEWPSDHDFNDVVVRMDVILPGDPAYPAIPEPTTAISAAALFAGTLLLRRKR